MPLEVNNLVIFNPYPLTFKEFLHYIGSAEVVFAGEHSLAV